MATSRRQHGSVRRQAPRSPQTYSSTWPPAPAGGKPPYVDDWSFGEAPPPPPPTPPKDFVPDVLVFGGIVAVIVCVLYPLSDVYGRAARYWASGGAVPADGPTPLTFGAAALFAAGGPALGPGGGWGLMGLAMLPLFLLVLSLMATAKRVRSVPGLRFGGILAIVSGIFVLPVGIVPLIGGVMHLRAAQRERPVEAPEFFGGGFPPPPG